jgi:hypothetical protein
MGLAVKKTLLSFFFIKYNWGLISAKARGAILFYLLIQYRYGTLEYGTKAVAQKSSNALGVVLICMAMFVNGVRTGTVNGSAFLFC